MNDLMKVTIRIPTRQYAYIEIETEVKDTKEAVDIYMKAEKEYKEESEKEVCCDDFPKCNHAQKIKKGTETKKNYQPF